MYEERIHQDEWSYGCKFSLGGDADADYDRHLTREAQVAARFHHARAKLAILILQCLPAPGGGEPLITRWLGDGVLRRLA